MTPQLPHDRYGLPPEYQHVYSGKVRDLFTTPGGELLFVASDRISAYDWVLPTLIPDKGKLLTAISLWWFERVADLVPNHVVSLDVPMAVAGRALLCRRLDMVPIECVARGYITGSGWAEYQASGGVCGIELPSGLLEAASLPTPIFTPATKAPIGEHDENIDFAQVVARVGADTAEQLRRKTLDVFARAEAISRSRGLIVADTKFEFGFGPDGRLVLADEVLTPDSSRYWPAEQWQPGRAQPSFDKQYLRDWLTSPAADWDRRGDAPPPPLPEDVVERTRAKYVDAFERLTGSTWQ